MKSKSNKTKYKTGIIPGVIAGLSVTVIMLAVSVVLIREELISEDSIKTINIIINIISAAICGAVTRAAGKRGEAIGLVAGIIYSVFFITPMLINDAGTADVLRILLISLIFSQVFFRLDLGKSNKKFRKKTKL